MLWSSVIPLSEQISGIKIIGGIKYQFCLRHLGKYFAVISKSCRCGRKVHVSQY